MSRINLEPLPGKIVVKPQSTDGMVRGLWIVRNDRQSVGEIMAVYEDFTDPDTDSDVAAFLKVGDTVIFGKHSGVEVTIDRERYIILRENEILCRVTDPAALEGREAEAG